VIGTSVIYGVAGDSSSKVHGYFTKAGTFEGTIIYEGVTYGVEVGLFSMTSLRFYFHVRM
jgi:hypothetical protein